MLKMQSKLLVIIAVFIFFSLTILSSQDNGNDERPTIPVGEFSWEEWQTKSGWDDHTAADYEPDIEYTNAIDSIFRNKNISFIIFTANWCPDSRSETPKIFKLFAVLDIPLSSVRLFGVDREKKEPTNTYLKYDPKKVPTLIVLIDSLEQGRIIEYPEASWEQDIFEIISK
jgi:thiol-disulfide isomerase/thioredoxin